MEQLDVNHWRSRLRRVINNRTFNQSTGDQKLQVLTEALRQSALPVGVFNRVIIEDWDPLIHGDKPIPQLGATYEQPRIYNVPGKPTDTSTNMPSFIEPQGTFQYRDSPQKSAANNLLEYVTDLFRSEKMYRSTAGEFMDIMQPLERLIFDIEVRSRMWNSGIGLVEAPQYNKEMQNWQQRLAEIMKTIKLHPRKSYPRDIDPYILEYAPDEGQSNEVMVGNFRRSTLDSLMKISSFAYQMLIDEVKRFGANTPFTTALRKISQEIVGYADSVLMDQISMTWKDVIARIFTWREQIAAILKSREVNGKRCRNIHDPLDGTPLSDVPSNEHIRLSNGICWKIKSLIEYVISTKGMNTASGLKNYGSATIWETDEDFNRILSHPVAREMNLAERLDDNPITMRDVVNRMRSFPTE